MGLGLVQGIQEIEVLGALPNNRSFLIVHKGVVTHMQYNLGEGKSCNQDILLD